MAQSVAREMPDCSAHLICFSHLRWNFVYQRPQHLMSRAAKSFSVWYFEEPEFFEGRPVLKIETQDCGVSVVTPMLPRSLPAERVNEALRGLLVGLLSKVQPQRLIAWYVHAPRVAICG